MRDVDTCSIQELQDILAKKQEDVERSKISALTNELLIHDFERFLRQYDTSCRDGEVGRYHVRVCLHRDELLKRLNREHCAAIHDPDFVVLPLTSEVT